MLPLWSRAQAICDGEGVGRIGEYDQDYPVIDTKLSIFEKFYQVFRHKSFHHQRAYSIQTSAIRMGKKRTRVPGEPRAVSKAEGAAAQHHSTLEDDVREQRDVQFALEKKQTDRAKRRRMAVEDDGKKDVTTAATKPKNRRAEVRVAGLQMWKNAAARRRKKTVPDDEDGENDAPVDGRTEKKIIEEARQQRAEIREEGGNTNASANGENSVNEVLRTLSVQDKDGGNNDDDDDDDDEDGEDDGRSVAADTEYEWKSTAGDDDRDLDFLDGSKVTDADELALSLFAAPPQQQQQEEQREASGGGGKIMLADIILQKIQEKEEENARAAEMLANPEKVERDRKIAEVYGLVGNIMAKYRSGKVPKAFKVIPKLPNWEELLYLTRPDEWSPAGVYVATRVLASNLGPKEVIPFYTDILLPRCLEDVADNKKLNVHLYRSLEKAVYKPSAFCKGIIFPLCEDGACTLRQATIIASVISKVSIPMLHSAAALLYICQLKFTVVSCMLMTTLIEKKYALPYRVVDAAVDWFLRMKTDERSLPLVWHKCLLAFAQRYKTELSIEQKEKLKMLMRVHTHRLITPEIRRELFSARNRGDLMDPDANTIARNIANAAVMVD